MSENPSDTAIALQPVSAENWRPVVRLQLKAGQENFVAPNWYSIIQSQFEGGSVRAINAGETLVGFVWYTHDPKTERWWIVRFMIAAEHQGKGYGRAALHAIVKEIRAVHHPTQVYISFVPQNEPARKLYESIGFVDTGEVDDGELVFRIDLERYPV